MNKRQVIILWVIAIALGAAVAAVKHSQNKTIVSATQRSRSQTLFESFPASDAATIEIQGASGTVSLAKKDGKWVVVDRNNYPANSTYVNDFLRTLADLKITLGMQAGPSFAPRFGMDESATKAEDRGLTATFKDASGKEIAKVSLGKSIDSSSEPSPMGNSSVGRYVRNHADESGFYAVSEMFPSVSAEAKRWLADGFISPEKVKSIAVTQPGKTDIAWKLVREGEDAEFKLEGGTATEVPDTTATAPLKSIFSYARFEDVVPPDKVADRIVADQKRTVTIDTFEGFVYTINISPTKPAAAPATPPAAGEEPAATDNFLMTVDVTAELPKERKKEDGEKPEDAKTKDTAFADRLKSLTEKIAKEKAFTGVTFEIGKSSVEALLKDRTAIITKATPPPAAGTQNSPMQKFPGGMIAPPPTSATTAPIEAVTPPISVPAADDDGEVNEKDEDDNQ
ncbi:MAG: DUF4340 domain-containing protein [Luteolibacter sp.]|uniref:DUF4340 domain-containing protein n=1 Tax=Luteolibacter sp. TaxID=1962973 RepID=UPI003262E749